MHFLVTTYDVLYGTLSQVLSGLSTPRPFYICLRRGSCVQALSLLTTLLRRLSQALLICFFKYMGLGAGVARISSADGTPQDRPSGPPRRQNARVVSTQKKERG